MTLSDNIIIAKHLCFLLRSQWWSADRIRQYQEDRLRRIMKYAVSHIPYYKSLGISADSIKSSHDLTMFPVITKKHIQENKDAFLLPTAQKEDLYVSRTSGTTCEPTMTYFDRDSWLLGKYALKIRRVVAVTNPLFKRCLIISDQNNQDQTRIKKSRVTPGNFLFAVKYKSLCEELDDHIRLILDYKPDIFYASPSYLSDVLARFKDKQLECPPVAVIFTSAELLTPKCRTNLESSFEGKVYDVYGSTEFKEVAWQCNRSRYHINCENIYLEAKADNNNRSQEGGRLLITSLTNCAMPLVRFDIGDTGDIHDGECDCGRSLPYLDNIAGRQTQYILLPSGKTRSPYLLTTIIEEVPEIRKYQIVQTSPSDLRIDITFSLNAAVDTVLHTLPYELQKVLKEKINITVNKVDHIRRSAGGKYQIVVRSF